MLLAMMNSSLDVSIANYGSDRFATAGTNLGYWFCIQALVDSTITVVGNLYGDPSNIPLSAGSTIYGEFTSLQLIGGQVLCYRRI